VELTNLADELYGLSPQEFTAARDARASQAGKGGDKDLALAVKRLRKPSTGAWMANQLVREQPRAIERLIELGATLRSARNLEGTQIRRATKEKAESVTKLVRQARSIATQAGQPVSQSAEQELEATLDAAFSDEGSADALLEGRLTAALHYSGLGFGAGATVDRRAATARASSGSTRRGSGAEVAKAERNLEQAQRDAGRADSELQKAQRAVTSAEADLKRLRAASTVAARQAKKAHEKAATEQRRLESLRRQ
jgi:hypothetical protein